LPIDITLGDQYWSNHIFENIDSFSDKQKTNWYNLFDIYLSQPTSKGKKLDEWRKNLTEATNTIGAKEAGILSAYWLAIFISNSKIQTDCCVNPHIDLDHTLSVARQVLSNSSLGNWSNDENTLKQIPRKIISGFVKTIGLSGLIDLSPFLSQLALIAYKKTTDGQLRFAKLGNFCVSILGNQMGIAGVEQLAYLKTKIKHGTVLNQIEKAFQAAAERLQIPRDDLEELALPTCGLTKVGYHEQALGEFVALLEIDDRNKPLLTWKTDSGKIQKTVPKSIKENFADELKQLKADIKEIQKMLPVLIGQLDRIFLREKSWEYATWKERYCDHPLMGTLARRVIWRFQLGEELVEGIYLNGQIVGIDAQPLTDL